MQALSRLANVGETRRVLERHGLMTKKALGQHFLVNDGIVRHICDLAELDSDDVVVEVGPGIGTLTVALLQRAGKVVSIEMDTDLPRVLFETCADWKDSFSLISGDALGVGPDQMPEVAGERLAPNKLVSNLPYAVGATIVLDYFQRYQSLESCTVMVQAEVADRMAAKLGTKNYGAYTVKLGLYANYVDRFPVSEGNFFPPPRVKSAVIRMDRKRDDIPRELRDAACLMADAAFATRRKTISNSCKTFFGNPANAATDVVELLPSIFEQAGVSPKDRGESLPLETYLALGQAYLDQRAQLGV
ncbi:MAG: 16S rRNA (adenine(1518)-N(6)/adenine(1519)-N(6))-dimethyltransferase RsmA [Coriobacteriia bacterium]|nr:16S rRNA (adenine(1518)-N(6)/adenine(1519)-N(6))-dimethyltransferase RsmA [Coriobacteriia bacterium]